MPKPKTMNSKERKDAWLAFACSASCGLSIKLPDEPNEEDEELVFETAASIADGMMAEFEGREASGDFDKPFVELEKPRRRRSRDEEDEEDEEEEDSE